MPIDSPGFSECRPGLHMQGGLSGVAVKWAGLLVASRRQGFFSGKN